MRRKSHNNRIDRQSKQQKIEDLKQKIQQELSKNEYFPLNDFNNEISYIENKKEHPKLYKNLTHGKITSNFKSQYISPFISNKIRKRIYRERWNL